MLIFNRNVPDVAATTGLESPSDADFSRVGSIGPQEQRAEILPGVSPSSLQVFTSEGMPEDSLRLILDQAMEQLGFRRDHIDTMQIDQIMEAFQSPEARQLQTMGQLGPNPLIPFNPVHGIIKEKASVFWEHLRGPAHLTGSPF